MGKIGIIIFYCLERIQVYRHLLIYPLLCPKFLAEKKLLLW